MKLQLRLLALIALLATFAPFPSNFPAPLTAPQVLAQTPTERKAEADRLFQQGIGQYQTSQFEAALQSWQQALIIYREIHDRQSEGKALGNLGIAYGIVGIPINPSLRAKHSDKKIVGDCDKLLPECFAPTAYMFCLSYQIL